MRYRRFVRGRFALSLLLIALAGCGSNDAGTPTASKPTTFSSKEFGFEMVFPAGWVLTEHPPAGMAALGTSPLPPGAKLRGGVKVFIRDVPERASLKALVEAGITDPPKGYDHFQLADKQSWQLAGKDAYRTTYWFDTEKLRETFQCIDYQFIANKRFYIIQTVALKAEYGRYEKEIEEIVTSFKLVKR